MPSQLVQECSRGVEKLLPTCILLQNWVHTKCPLELGAGMKVIMGKEFKHLPENEWLLSSLDAQLTLQGMENSLNVPK